MADKELTIRVNVDSSGAVQGFDELERKTDEVAQSADDAGGSFENFSGRVQSVAKVAAGAIAGVTAAIVGIGYAAKQGSGIDDVASAFNRLSSQAGAASDALLNDLNQAFGETISKTQLMESANRGLIAGLKPEVFVEVADAARAYADSVGGDAKKTFDEFVEGLAKGNDRFLKQRGIIVDVDAALDDYASSIGTTKDNLTEFERASVTQQVSLDALRSSLETLGGKVENDVGDAIDKLIAKFQNAKDELFSSIGTSEDLKEALEELGRTIGQIDVGELARQISELSAQFLTLATQIIPPAVKGLENFGRGLLVLGNLWDTGFSVDHAVVLTSIQEVLEKNERTIKKATEAQKKAIEADSARTKAAQLVNSTIESAVKLSGELTEGTKLSNREFARLREEFTKLPPSITGTVEEQSRFNQALATGRAAIGDYIRTQEENRKASERAREEHQKHLSELKKLNSVEGYVGLKKSIDELLQTNADGVISFELMSQELDKVRLRGLEAGIQIEQLDRIFGASLNDIRQKIEKTSKSGPSLFESLLGLDMGGETDPANITRELGATIRDIFSGISDVFKDGKITGEDQGSILGTVGTSIGAAIGGITGGPGGAVQGAQIGAQVASLVNTVVDLVGSLFSSDNAGTKFRKAIDGFFADAFDANRLSVVVDGQLQQIKDLDFGGTEFGDGSKGFFNVFDGMSQSAQIAFVGIARGFAELTGQGQEFASSLAAAFTNNVGGSLNNLQLLVQASGKSFEELRGQIVEAFLDGKLSFIEAQDALVGIQRVAEKGIPDALGDVVGAVKNLQNATVNGGRASVDALQDIAAEALELGLNTLPEVQRYLESTGEFSSDSIRKVFNALDTYGISTVEGLRDATAEQLIPVLANLEATEFPFAKAIDDAEKLIEKVESIPNRIEKRINFKITTETDSNTQKLADQGAFNSAGLKDPGFG